MSFFCVADRVAELLALRRLLPALRVEGRGFGRKLAEIRHQHLLLALAQLGCDVLRPGDRGSGERLARLSGGKRGAAAKRFGAPGRIIRGGGSRFRVGCRRVEFDKLVARLHGAVVGHVDRSDLARFERFDHFHAAGRLKLALRGGDDVDAAEIGPDQRRRDKGADDPDEGDPDGRGRRFQDFEGRREELPVGEAAVRDEPGQRAGPRRPRSAQLKPDKRPRLAHDASSWGWLWSPQK